MIPVQQRPEPADFYELVAKPGEAFLKLYPSPTSNQWDKHAYWQRVLDHLEQAYDAICAYSAFRIQEHTGSRSVDHFRPKTESPSRAYDWSNYRLACARSNSTRSRKKILDPFEIHEKTFAILFPSCEVICGPSCEHNPALALAVEQTCEALNLNSQRLKDLRVKFVREFAFDHVSFPKLQADAPFLALELERQGLTDKTALFAMMSFDDPYPKTSESSR